MTDLVIANELHVASPALFAKPEISLKAALDEAFPAKLNINPEQNLCLHTLYGWMFLLVLHALALHRFILGGDPAKRLHDIISYMLHPAYFSLGLLSCGLALAFQRWGDWMLLPKNIIKIGVLLLCIALPFIALNSALLELFLTDQPLANLAAEIKRRGAYRSWLDSCFTISTYLIQVSYIAWRRARAQTFISQNEQNENLELRLQLLKSQLKPHFLFNALNSISALVRTADAELASNAVHQLRNLLCYVVHASKHDSLSVAEELSFIQAYLELQLLRFSDRLTILWEIAPAPWEQLACPPLLFHPLVENAIHHAVEQHRAPCRISISLELKDGSIYFRIANPQVGNVAGNRGHGLGLRSTRERLSILYADEASLSIANQDDMFSATLYFPARVHDEN